MNGKSRITSGLHDYIQWHNSAMRLLDLPGTLSIPRAALVHKP